MTGVEMIQAERERQISVEGWSPEHDDAHTEEQLANAAGFYIDAAALVAHGLPFETMPWGWQWGPKWYKPSSSPIRNLVKAGALIAAEIDRLQRLSK